MKKLYVFLSFFVFTEIGTASAMQRLSQRFMNFSKQAWQRQSFPKKMVAAMPKNRVVMPLLGAGVALAAAHYNQQPAECLTCGVALYRIGDVIIIAIADLHDDDKYPHLKTVHVKQMKNLIRYLKTKAVKKTYVTFFSEARAYEKEYVSLRPTFDDVTLHVPMIDAVRNGFSGNNFKYVWYDLRDKQDAYLIDHKTYLQTPPERLKKHYLDAQKIVQKADIAADIKAGLSGDIDEVYGVGLLALAVQFPVMNPVADALCVDTDTNLTCSVLEEMGFEGKTVLVAQGGAAHIAKFIKGLAHANITPVKTIGRLTLIVSQDQVVFVNNFGDEAINFMEEK